MFVYNFKVNGNKFYHAFFAILIIATIILFALAVYNVFSSVLSASPSSENITVNDIIPQEDISEISSKNYTNVLKQIHDNLDNYIGRKISFTGYIYRIEALENNQFVLARNMIINSASQSVIVGFLCEYNDISSFNELSWVHVTGTIEKGTLDGDDIPVLHITDIKETTKPVDEFVYPPDDTYIPTSVLY